MQIEMKVTYEKSTETHRKPSFRGGEYGQSYRTVGHLRLKLHKIANLFGANSITEKNRDRSRRLAGEEPVAEVGFRNSRQKNLS